MKRLLISSLIALLPAIAVADYKGELSQDQAWEKIEAKQMLVIDVRTPAEFAEGHVPGAMNIPHDQIGQRQTEIAGNKEQAILLYCRSGRRSGMAEKTMTELGFSSLYHLEGDMMGWIDANRPIEK